MGYKKSPVGKAYEDVMRAIKLLTEPCQAARSTELNAEYLEQLRISETLNLSLTEATALQLLNAPKSTLSKQKKRSLKDYTERLRNLRRSAHLTPSQYARTRLLKTGSLGDYAALKNRLQGLRTDHLAAPDFYQRVIRQNIESNTLSQRLQHYLKQLERFRQALFTEVTQSLKNQVMITSEELFKSLDRRLNSLHSTLPEALQLNPEEYAFYASVDLYLNQIIQQATQRYTEISKSTAKRPMLTVFQGNFITTPGRRNQFEKESLISFIIKARFTKLVSFSLLPERKDNRTITLSPQNKRSIQQFIHTTVDSESSDIATLSLRKHILKTLSAIIAKNQEKEMQAFFSSTKRNYQDRVLSMRNFKTFLTSREHLLHKDIELKATNLRQVCNNHTSLFSRWFSDSPTKTAGAIDQIRDDIHQEKLITRFREETEVHLS